MTDPMAAVESIGRRKGIGLWTGRLVWFLRAMAALSLLKGLYHWAVVVGFGEHAGSAFETSSTAWQAATMFFAVIDLVAAVGLWLAAAWGGVVWLTAAISMAAVELFFPQIYGGSFFIVLSELAAILAYVALSVMAARERPP
jgi:Family of unknown function (DUF6163)